MRTNSTKKIHKMKRDPYKSLLRFMAVMAAVAVVGAGVFYLCTLAVQNDYITTRDRINAENATGEAQFTERMNELRAQNQRPVLDGGDKVISLGEHPYWEELLDGELWRVTDEGSQGLENTSTIQLTRQDMMHGGLLLVNEWHALPTDFTDEGLLAVGTTGDFKIQVQDGSVKLFRPAFDALVEALKAAKEQAGLEYYIVREGYRSVAQQQTQFDKAMEELSSRYSGERLVAEAKKKVNLPGTSDYHSGLSFRMDVYNRNDSQLNNMKFQAETEQAKWLTANCWKYGIIFRFPTRDFPNADWEDKSYKTGVSSNLNLYRYVGKAHSAAMRVLNLCLEEYVEFLMDHPHICIYQDGALVYEVVRIKGADGSETFSLPVPNPASSYEASLDNMDGVVLAYSYGK